MSDNPEYLIIQHPGSCTVGNG